MPMIKWMTKKKKGNKNGGRDKKHAKLNKSYFLSFSKGDVVHKHV